MKIINFNLVEIFNINKSPNIIKTDKFTNKYINSFTIVILWLFYN